MPEAWLRGPVDGVPTELMPVAHSLTDAIEEIEPAVVGLDSDRVWARPGGAASIGFHLRHARGSIERLLTYARGEALAPDQLAEIAREGDPGEDPADARSLFADLREAVERVLEVLRQTTSDDLDRPRTVGRAGLPSTTRGLLFHIAEHTRRHAGQIVTTAKIVQGSRTKRDAVQEIESG